MQAIKHPRLLFILSLFCATAISVQADEGAKTMSLTLTSPAFSHHAETPKRFTCDGDNVSPALQWTGIPVNTKSLALIVDDPDAPDPASPKIIWVHWLLYNIPPSSSGLPENIAVKDLPPGTLQGRNDWKQPGYRGPCPPIGKHRYFFKLFALDQTLADMNLPDKTRLEQAMAGHIIEQAELIGTYQRR